MEDQPAAKPKPIIVCFCPACEQDIPESEMQPGGADGWGRVQVCRLCWQSFRPFQRLLLHILATPRDEIEYRGMRGRPARPPRSAPGL